MFSRVEKIVTVVAIVVLAGCTGKDFLRPDSASIDLQQ